MTSLAALSAPQNSVALWGDSTSTSTGAASLETSVSSVLLAGLPAGYSVTNCGIGGHKPFEIRRRFLQMPVALYDQVHIAFLGRIEQIDGVADTELGQRYIDDIEAILAHPAGPRTLICTPTNRDDAAVDRAPDGTCYLQRVIVNDYLIANHADRLIDVQQALIDSHDPNDAGDVADIAALIQPGSGRVDAIHNNDKGHTVIAAAMLASLNAGTWLV